jgi:hypothetical protein
MDLRLKSYVVLKWQRLDCKYKSNTGARLKLEQDIGALVEDLWDL